MSFLNKLLDGVAVEWKELGDVIRLEKGRQLNKELLCENGPYPAYNGGVTHSGFTDTFNYSENKTIISQGGASAGFVNFVTSRFYANAHCYVVLPNTEAVENRYVYHLLKLNQERLTGKQHGAGIPALRPSEILEIPIPIPCPDNPKKSLEIQTEIVRILDAFTAVTSELTSELTTRKKQYNYYRDRLLSFENDEVEWQALGESVEIKRGKRLVKSQLQSTGDFAVFQNSMTPLGYYHESNVKADTTFIICAGSAGEIGYSSKEFWAADDVYFFTTQNGLLNKFLYYFLLTQQPKILSQVRRSSVPRLSKTSFDKLEIPIPPLKKQARIVAILDKFDALTNSLTEGLPREIELRQKQYAHYRDLLLGFTKPHEVAT